MTRFKGFDKDEYERRTAGFEIHADLDPEAEGSFSWHSCDTCGTELGGNRTRCGLTNAGIDPKTGKRYPLIEVMSCDDCIYYAANGHLPGEED